MQVDAAINPGNSGGPALIDGKMIGLIFSKLTQADNIGYIIPSEEIDLFLKDVADGHYDGKPAMHEPLQTLENDALRSFLRLDRKTQGMVVHAPNPADPKRPAQAVGPDHQDRRPRDRQHGHGQDQRRPPPAVPVPDPEARQGRQGAADGHPPGEDDDDRPAGQAALPHADRVAPGEVSVVLRLRAAGLLAGDHRAGRRRSAGSPRSLAIIGSPLVTRRGDQPKFEGEELVIVASPMFPHKIAKGYDNPSYKVVKEINGIRIKNLRHMVEILRDSKEKYTTISFDDRASETIVFDHKEALNATEEILSDNGIRQQASDDLAAIWSKKK